MRFFIDTANLEEIKYAQGLGWLDGVTTNPSLLAKEGVSLGDRASYVEKVCKLVEGCPVSVEVLSLQADEMVREGLELSEIADNVVVKIPMTEAGLQATKSLASRDIPTNVTLVFSANQALLAAKAGATYVSPFVGRLDDVGTSGMDLVAEIIDIYQNYLFETQILAASIRHPEHVLRAALLGADVATAGLKVLKQLARHPLTDIGLETFLKDAQKTN